MTFEENIRKAINKTGFILENDVIKILENENWNTINNRYYIDDITSSPREIDIVAYKANEHENILYYTALIISCKKSEQNSWVFLTRNINNNDPNIDFFPIEYWSNSRILNSMDSEEKYRDYIEKNVNKLNHYKSIFGIKKNIFAFQEVNIKNSTPQNDKKIYESIISTIKAMEYEKKSLNKRKKNPTVFNFHLLTIIDGDTYEFDVNRDSKVVESNHIKYLNRFIVNNDDKFHMIHFINYKNLKSVLTKINQLHTENSKFHSDIIDKYKSEFLISYTLRNIFKEEIQKELIPIITGKIAWEYEIAKIKISELYLLEGDNGSLKISLKIDIDKIICRMNEDVNLQSKTSEIIKKWCKFEGNIYYAKYDMWDDIPF
jgi:uncharacterized protein (UPF0335 family)